jgi:hypothetical protein
MLEFTVLLIILGPFILAWQLLFGSGKTKAKAKTKVCPIIIVDPHLKEWNEYLNTIEERR